MTHIGYQLSSITPYLDTLDNLRRAFKKIANMGYKYVQLQGASLDIPDSEIRKALDGNELICVATQEDYILGFGDDPDRYIRRAVTVGAKCLAFALMPFDISTPEELEEFAQKILVIKDKVNCAGLDFAFHPIGPDYRIMEGIPVYERLMSLLPEDTQLVLCVQSTFGGPVHYKDVLKKFAGRIRYVHFKDGILLPENASQLMSFGDVEDDWVQIYETDIPAGVNNLAFMVNTQEIKTKSQLNAHVRKVLRIKKKVERSELSFAYYPTCVDFVKIDGVPIIDIVLREMAGAAHILLGDTSLIQEHYERLCREYPERVHVIRPKGEKIRPGFKVQLMPLGEGEHCFEEIWSDCVTAGVEYVFTEQERWNRDAFDCAKASLDYMKVISKS